MTYLRLAAIAVLATAALAGPAHADSSGCPGTGAGGKAPFSTAAATSITCHTKSIVTFESGTTADLAGPLPDSCAQAKANGDTTTPPLLAKDPQAVSKMTGQQLDELGDLIDYARAEHTYYESKKHPSQDDVDHSDTLVTALGKVRFAVSGYRAAVDAEASSFSNQDCDQARTNGAQAVKEQDKVTTAVAEVEKALADLTPKPKSKSKGKKPKK